MLSLAELILSLSQATISVTFITTDAVTSRLTRHSDVGARFAKYGPRFSLQSVPDGLGPDDYLRGADQIGDVTDSLATQALDAGSRLRAILTYGSLWGQSDPRPVTCIIADGFFWFMVDVTKELRVPLVYFDTVSPGGLWTFLYVPRMVQLGQLPFRGNDLDAQVTSVPGMEGYLRRRDLPSFCRTYDPNNQLMRHISKEAVYYPRAQGHILNTFDDLEAPLLSHMRDLCPNLYTIGPLHSLIRAKVEPIASKNASSSSLWEEDRSCLAWLDAQPSKSVLYVSIGSLAVMTRHQLTEFWHGLVHSKTRFLWVRRPGSIIETGHDDEVPMELEEGTRERGRLVSWVPQEEVLAHQAIGGFLTHSGWNSTLESTVAGVPMICWPFFVDQQVNSRMVSKVWGVGLDMKDTCDRVTIEKMIRELIGNQRERFAAKMDNLTKLAAKAVDKGGTSYCNLDRLIDDIQFNRFPMPS